MSSLAAWVRDCYRHIVEVSQDQAPLGHDPAEPAPQEKLAGAPPPTQVPLIDLDLEGEPASVASAVVPTAPPEGAISVAAEVPAETEAEPTQSEASPVLQPPPPVPPPQPPPPPARGRSAQRLVTGASSATSPPASPTRPQVDPLDARPQLRPSRGSEIPSEFQRTGHPVRDRMLAKAAEAAKSGDPGAPASAQPAGSPALSSIDQELEQLAGPRQQLLSRPVRLGNAVLSPTTTLIGVTLVGLAAIASLFLLLVQFAPRNPQDAATPAQAQPLSPVATAAQAGSAAVILNLPPPVAPPQRTKEPGPWRIEGAEAGQKLVRGTIGPNPFLKAVQEAGLDKSQAYRVYGALKQHKDFDHCNSRDTFAALINRADKRVVAFEYIVGKEEVYQAREGEGGKLVGKPLDLKVSKHRVQGSILVTSNGFAAAARDAGLEASITNVINRALSGHTNTSQFHPGDRLRVVAQEVTVLGEFHRYAGIEALEYVPVDGDPTRIYYHAAKRQYYDAKGRAPGEGGWRNPVRGAPITSKFNPHRMHPILKKKMPHNGTDFGAPTGTPVYASSYGKIAKLGNYGANGNYIAITHDNGYETGYSHLSRFEPGIKVGDNVKRSQVIGYVGTTGRSTGPHLHFSARKDGAYIDAETLHLDALTVLPSAERAIFGGVREKYDALLEAVALPPPLPPQLLVAAPAASAIEGQLNDEGADEGDEAATPGSNVAATSVQPVNAVPALPVAIAIGAPAVNVAPPTVAPPAAGGAFFLTDQELLQAQPLVDDGEVDE